MPASIAVVFCAVLELEIETFAQRYPNCARLEKLPQGLHNEPDRLRRELQVLVDQIETESPQIDTIVVGYGLCSRGTEGVTTRRCRLVIPRAHDCITLLLGSKERYASYARLHPGTYWYSPGWNRHHVAPGQQRYELLRTQYVEKYGEDNADFLMEEEQRWFSTYDRATFVDLRVLPTEQDEAYTKACADWLGWDYDRQVGDPELLQTLLTGPWDDGRFLVLTPGQTLRMTADERVMEVVDAARP